MTVCSATPACPLASAQRQSAFRVRVRVTDIQGVVIFRDRIVVHGAMLSSHNVCPARMFDLLMRYTLTLNDDKCIFAPQSLNSLGSA